MTAANKGAPATTRSFTREELELLAWAAEQDQTDSEHAAVAREIRGIVQRLLRAGCGPAEALQLGLLAALYER